MIGKAAPFDPQRRVAIADLRPLHARHRLSGADRLDERSDLLVRGAAGEVGLRDHPD